VDDGDDPVDELEVTREAVDPLVHYAVLTNVHPHPGLPVGRPAAETDVLVEERVLCSEGWHDVAVEQVA
jgi:hypothetical protein